MSNALAIAGVTAVLCDLLNNGLIDHDLPGTVGVVRVTCDPPDIIVTGPDEESRLNLYLYAVTPNQGWRNNALPALDAAGQRIANPPLALDLHYLLTAYGTKDFRQEILLGYGMQILHETPVLTRDAIRNALNAGSGVPPVDGSALPGAFALLGAAELAEQAEQIRITPHYMNTEELSKLWAATKANYRATCAYNASVVLIESRRAARAALPVRQRNLLTVTLERPHIDRISPQSAASGATLSVTGRNLRGPITSVTIGGIEQSPLTLAAGALTVTVPAAARAGVTALQVVQRLDFGTGSPAEPHRGFESNTVAFMLVPTLTVPASVARGAALTIGVLPPVERDQRAVLLLDDRAFELPPRPAGSAPSNTLSLVIPADMPVKAYFVRLLIDGAQSALAVQTDAQEPDPLRKQYVGPLVSVT